MGIFELIYKILSESFKEYTPFFTCLGIITIILFGELFKNNGWVSVSIFISSKIASDSKVLNAALFIISKSSSYNTYLVQKTNLIKIYLIEQNRNIIHRTMHKNRNQRQKNNHRNSKIETLLYKKAVMPYRMYCKSLVLL